MTDLDFSVGAAMNAADAAPTRDERHGSTLSLLLVVGRVRVSEVSGGGKGSHGASARSCGWPATGESESGMMKEEAGTRNGREG